jgi:hypothetical protein
MEKAYQYKTVCVGHNIYIENCKNNFGSIYSTVCEHFMVHIHLQFATPQNQRNMNVFLDFVMPIDQVATKVGLFE